MSNRFMVSVAALALIAGTGLANAQGGMKGGESSGSTMQHSAPSAAPSQSDSSSGPAKSESSESKSGMSKGDMKSSQSEKSPGAMKNQSAQENTKDSAKEKGATTNQRAEDRAKGSETNQRAEDRAKGGDRDNMKAEGRDTKSGTHAAETKSSTTIGQAGAGAKLTTEQRTKITSVIHSQHVESVKNVNFSISVGTRVPREGVHFYPLPAEVVTIYPQWRGYDYIVVNERIIIIDPHSYEIVEIIES